MRPPGSRRSLASGGSYAYGSYPDIDGLFRDQATELDPKSARPMLHRIQQLIHEKVMYLPIWQLSFCRRTARGSRSPGLVSSTDYPWSAPYEELKLKGK